MKVLFGVWKEIHLTPYLYNPVIVKLWGFPPYSTGGLTHDCYKKIWMHGEPIIIKEAFDERS